MAVNAEFNRKHPRHEENGRFREKTGSDTATSYARRIADRIGAHLGRSNKDQQRERAGEYRAQEKAAGGPTATEADAQRAIRSAQRARDAGAETKAQLDAHLHKKYKDATTAELRALIKQLKSERGLYRNAVVDSLTRLIQKNGD